MVNPFGRFKPLPLVSEERIAKAQQDNPEEAEMLRRTNVEARKLNEMMAKLDRQYRVGVGLALLVVIVVWLVSLRM